MYILYERGIRKERRRNLKTGWKWRGDCEESSNGWSLGRRGEYVQNTLHGILKELIKYF